MFATPPLYCGKSEYKSPQTHNYENHFKHIPLQFEAGTSSEEMERDCPSIPEK
jgi:hypothetical protein